MELFEAIKNRRSIRSFDNTKTILEEDIKKILDAGRSAPSAGRIFPVDLLVFDDKEIKLKLALASFNQMFISDASHVIIVLLDQEKTARKYGERGRNLFSIQDSAAVTENILLASTALGYSTCWIGAFDEKSIIKILDLKENQRPVALVPVGFMG